MVKYLTITLIAVALFIFLKNEYSYKLLFSENYGMPALIREGHVDNLYVGSSMFRQGLDIDCIDKIQGGSNYILAYNGNQPVLEYYQLKNLMEQSVDIGTLYVDMYVYAMCASPKISDEKMLMEIGLRNKWTLWKVLSENSENRSARTFWQFFVDSNNELLITWPITRRTINNKFYKGGNTAKTEASTEEQLMSLKVPEFVEQINSIQRSYTQKMIELAKSSGIRVIYIESPKYGTVAENEDYLNLMNEYAKLLDLEKTEYILCDKTWNAIGSPNEITHYAYNHYDSKCFVDTGHLSYDGRVLFTEQFLTVQNAKIHSKYP